MQTIYTENVLDTETGEIIPKRWITRKVQNTEMFVRTYIQDIGALIKCSGSEKSVVLHCIKYLDYNTNKFYLDSKRKQEISEEAGVAENTLNVLIPRLVKKNIFIKESNVAYILNPKLFFFGTDIERAKLFDLNIRYEIGGE